MIEMKHKQDMEIRKIIGRKIAQIRKSKGMSQTFVASLIGKTPQWLSNVERGFRSISVVELGQLSNILGVDVVDFYNDRAFQLLMKASKYQYVMSRAEKARKELEQYQAELEKLAQECVEGETTEGQLKEAK